MSDGRLKIGSDFLKIGSLYLRIGPAPSGLGTPDIVIDEWHTTDTFQGVDGSLVDIAGSVLGHNTDFIEDLKVDTDHSIWILRTPDFTNYTVAHYKTDGSLDIEFSVGTNGLAIAVSPLAANGIYVITGGSTLTRYSSAGAVITAISVGTANVCEYDVLHDQVYVQDGVTLTAYSPDLATTIWSITTADAGGFILTTDVSVSATHIIHGDRTTSTGPLYQVSYYNWNDGSLASSWSLTSDSHRSHGIAFDGKVYFLFRDPTVNKIEIYDSTGTLLSTTDFPSGSTAFNLHAAFPKSIT